MIKTAARMGYRPNVGARMIRSRRSGNFGILIFDHPFKVMHHRLHHVLKEVRDAGYRPFVHLADTSREDETQDGCYAMLDAKVEGLMLVDPIDVSTESVAKILADESIPVVSLGSYEWKTIPSYQADRKKGFVDLTEHLIARGCGSIRLLREKGSGEGAVCSKRFIDDMTEGFESTARRWRKKGYAVTTGVTTFSYSDDVKGSETDIHPIYRHGYYGMKSILQSGVLPDAILCQADFWAQGALRACREEGISVPGDLLITGFNNEPSSSAGLVPLTTIEQPGALLAKRAITDLIKYIEGGKTFKAGKVTTMPGHLIVRESTFRAIQ